jgi:hypothetical protein
MTALPDMVLVQPPLVLFAMIVYVPVAVCAAKLIGDPVPDTVLTNVEAPIINW